MTPCMKRFLIIMCAGGAFVPIGSSIASAKSCEELRSLCWTMRDDKSDCTKPYQRCKQTGVFVTPLGRVFKATK